MIQVQAMAALSATTPLVPFSFEQRDPRDNDVVIEILYCGICHSDLHIARNDWGRSAYPVVPGHEIIGQVVSVGKNVRKFKKGDRVGVGCLVDSCQHCDPCAKGLEQYCKETPTFTYNSVDRIDQRPAFGGYSEKIIVSDKFVLKIPEGMDLKKAAPLLCAGITTWSPLRHWKVGKGSQVAVVGLGGLGHMAIKLAKALGANVTLFTRSKEKESDARRLGADHIVFSTNKNEMASVKGKFDLILNTVPYAHDLNPYVATLVSGGTLVVVGLLGDIEPPLNTVAMIMGRKSVAGSVIGGIAETQEMLDFCGQHGITPEVEMINVQEINNAYERLLKSDVKYRFVIDMASLRA